MKFKVGDKVKLTKIPKWYGGVLQLNKDCTVIKEGTSSHIIWVCDAAGVNACIYADWASAAPTKHQQLLFTFMY